MEDLEQHMNKFVPTGTSDCYSKDNGERFRIETNEHSTLYFGQTTTSKYDERFHHFDFDLFRTYSQLDLFDLQDIVTKNTAGKELPGIDKETFLSVYEGHTFFSLFIDSN